MDIADCTTQIPVKFIKGNCENYNFNKDDTIIMSHVLEHLHDPRKFVKNCLTSLGKSERKVFI